MSNYKKTIGIEVHVEVLTNTKIFSKSINGYSDSVNRNVNVIDLGYPGVLPTINKEAVDLAISVVASMSSE